ncbi:amidohydrolase family protein [Streptomyces sp. NBC_00882]|uniref:amidohydrolase family protein n=1 Tax=Streptomyces TaxID=1883 RepID=UPI0038650A67|nr:amidohydrolase family protein [Streptomyces sp. NBC_00882]WSZ55123.1 amidohydrolase family protein [Streptomyces canus]
MTSTEPQPPPAAIDTHAHVFTRGLRLAHERRYSPDYEAPVDVYLSLLDAHGLAGGVLVQPSFLGTDNSYLLDALGKAPRRLRGVAVIDHRTPGEELDQLAEAGVCGIRLNLIRRPVPQLGEPTWQRLARELATRKLHLEVQAHERQWEELEPWLLRWPGPVVIDHLGLPTAASLSFCGSAALCRLLAAPHVWVKASAPYRSAPRAATAMVRGLLCAGGGERMLWGSDWPWTRHEEARVYSTTLTWLTAELSPTEVQRILSANPARLFDWAPSIAGADR